MATSMSPEMAGENTAWVALTTVVLLSTLAVASVALRLYTRIVLVKSLGIDDYTVLIALLFTLAEAGVIVGNIPFGLGRHTALLSKSSITAYLRMFYWMIIFYNIALTLIKLAFIFQYYRLIGISNMKRVIWIIGTIIMLWSMAQVLVAILTCIPIQKFWDTNLLGTCIPNLPLKSKLTGVRIVSWYINAAGNIVTDLSIMIMPLPVLSKLQLARKQKFFLIGIFCLGFFTTALSLLRLQSLHQSADFTFTNVPSSCWSFAELSCGILCVCLPTLRPLVSRLKPQWMELTRRSRGGASGAAKTGYGASNAARGGTKASRIHEDDVPLRSAQGTCKPTSGRPATCRDDMPPAEPSAAQISSYSVWVKSEV